MTITAAYLRECVDYFPDTGDFVWRARPRSHFNSNQHMLRINKMRAGQVAGCEQKSSGYRSIQIARRQYYSHRLAFLWMTGEWPKDQIDHINRKRNDNRWANLRSATAAENAQNIHDRIDSRSGVLGITWGNKSGRWMVRIGVNNGSVWLGQYDDFFDACCARKSAENKYDWRRHETARVGGGG